MEFILERSLLVARRASRFAKLVCRPSYPQHRRHFRDHLPLRNYAREESGNRDCLKKSVAIKVTLFLRDPRKNKSTCKYCRHSGNVQLLKSNTAIQPAICAWLQIDFRYNCRYKLLIFINEDAG